MKRSKTLIVAIPIMIILIAGVIYRYGFERVNTELAAIKEDQAMGTKTLGKYISLISEKPLLEKKLASLTETQKTDSSKLIEGQTPSLAAATLQDTINGIITGKGGTISSERVGKSEDLGKFKAIRVTIDAVVPDAKVLSDILYSIETQTPFLVVKELDTRVRDFRNPKELMVKIDVSAITGGK